MNKEGEEALRDLEKKGVRIHRTSSNAEVSQTLRKIMGGEPGM